MISSCVRKKFRRQRVSTDRSNDTIADRRQNRLFKILIYEIRLKFYTVPNIFSRNLDEFFCLNKSTNLFPPRRWRIVRRSSLTVGRMVQSSLLSQIIIVENVRDDDRYWNGMFTNTYITPLMNLIRISNSETIRILNSVDFTLNAISPREPL